jgi:hypothetical protein
MAVTEGLRYTPDSLQLRDELQDRIWKKLRTLVEQRVSLEHRTVVTGADIKACVALAAEEVLRELETEGHLEPDSESSAVK